MSALEDMMGQALEGRVAAPDDDGLEKLCPDLWELLTLDQYKDKTKRMLPELTVNRVPGGYEVTLKDHEMCLQVTTFSPILSAIGQALEAALHDPTRPWKPFQSYRNRKGPKVPEGNASGQKRQKRVK
jgi:hypothetical protein